jgi:PAS domain S-box-containing protein
MSASSVPESGSPRAEQRSGTRPRLRVLQVEDSSTDAALIVRALERSGFEVEATRADSAAEMRAALASHTFDVIISDYLLPQFDAPAALRILHETGADIPFIVVSGTIGEDVAVLMMRAGAHDYILKDNLTRLQPAVSREIADAQMRRARRAAETALRESEERLALAIDATQLGTFDFNPQTGQLIWSHFGKRHFGLSPDAIVSGDQLWGAVHPDDRERVRTFLETAFRAGHDGYYSTEYRTIGIEDGLERWLSTRGRILCDAEGRPTRFIGVSIDMTERTRLEAALRESAEREAQANRIKDQFLANLSHELRTPLNVILGYSRSLVTRTLEQTPQDFERVNRTIRVIERNATTQLRIVEDLLDVQRIVSGRLQTEIAPCDLRQLAQGVVDSLMPSALSKRLQMQIHLEPLEISCDAARIQQVMWNLLGNAVKFTPEGGQIDFDVIRRGDSAMIQVRDTGEGIPTHFLPYVFERFRQLDMTSTRRHDGLGLGLSIVKHVVELHGGSVKAESPGVGRGATFTVILPDAQREQVPTGVTELREAQVLPTDQPLRSSAITDPR